MEFHWHDIWWSFSECLPKVAGSSSLERVVAGAGIHWIGSFRFNSTQWPRLVFTWMPEIPSLPTDLLQEFQLNNMDTPCLLFSGKIICNYNRRDALEGKEERTTFKVGQHQENANKQQSRRMRNVTFPLSATDATSDGMKDTHQFAYIHHPFSLFLFIHFLCFSSSSSSSSSSTLFPLTARVHRWAGGWLLLHSCLCVVRWRAREGALLNWLLSPSPG